MIDGLGSELELKLDGLPTQPGVYLFKDAESRVLYVGKAKNLRSRVRSYFQLGGSDERMYLPTLISLVRDCSTIITRTEKEAAILENSLIKEHQPRFNVKLRDDKEFLSLRLDPKTSWPRLQLVRKPKADGADYFGPYHSATAARRTLHLVEKHFKLRTCSDLELRSRKRPCLKYQIKRCPAPCVYEVDRHEYAQQVASVELFLDGRHDELTSELERRMRQASARLDYELAAGYRDQLRAVDSIRQAQRVVSVEPLDQDVVGLYRQADLVELSLLTVREGRVVEALTFSQRGVEISDDEVIAALLRETYGEMGTRSIPDRILVPALPDGAAGVEEWLSERRGSSPGVSPRRARRRVELACPLRGPRKALLDLAQENARHAFEEKRRSSEDVDLRLSKLQARLRLPSLPRHIECADISHLGGRDTVGSVVALRDGEPDKRGYRTYKVKTAIAGDDYAAMYEVLSRRFRRGRDALRAEADGAETDGAEADGAVDRSASQDWELPDLFVVDGGRGQLAVAQSAAQDLGLFELRLCGLAKERENTAGDKLVDRVYLPGQKNPIALRPNCPELFVLARARDEAHRFANRGREKLGKARRMQSRLDRVAGIGPKSKDALLRHFGGIDNLRSATPEELLRVPGITRAHVRALDRYWQAEARSEADSPETESPETESTALQLDEELATKH